MSKHGKHKIKKVMGEFKRRTLRSGRSGKKVTKKSQAVAIALSEARKAGARIPKPKRIHSNLSHLVEPHKARLIELTERTGKRLTDVGERIKGIKDVAKIQPIGQPIILRPERPARPQRPLRPVVPKTKYISRIR